MDIFNDLLPVDKAAHYVTKQQAATLAGVTLRTIELKIADATFDTYQDTSLIAINSLVEFIVDKRVIKSTNAQLKLVDLQMQQLKLADKQGQLLPIEKASQIGTDIGTLLTNHIDDIIARLLLHIARTKRTKAKKDLETVAKKFRSSLATTLKATINNQNADN